MRKTNSSLVFSDKSNLVVYRVNLNLTNLNKLVEAKHFKMEYLQTALNLLLPGKYQASCDFTHGYYSVPVARSFQKYLKFMWEDQLFDLFHCGSKWALLCSLQLYQCMPCLENQGHLWTALVILMTGISRIKQ